MTSSAVAIPCNTSIEVQLDLTSAVTGANSIPDGAPALIKDLLSTAGYTGEFKVRMKQGVLRGAPDKRGTVSIPAQMAPHGVVKVNVQPAGGGNGTRRQYLVGTPSGVKPEMFLDDLRKAAQSIANRRDGGRTEKEPTTVTVAPRDELVAPIERTGNTQQTAVVGPLRRISGDDEYVAQIMESLMRCYPNGRVPAKGCARRVHDDPQGALGTFSPHQISQLLPACIKKELLRVVPGGYEIVATIPTETTVPENKVAPVDPFAPLVAMIEPFLAILRQSEALSETIRELERNYNDHKELCQSIETDLHTPRTDQVRNAYAQALATAQAMEELGLEKPNLPHGLVSLYEREVMGKEQRVKECHATMEELAARHDRASQEQTMLQAEYPFEQIERARDLLNQLQETIQGLW